MHTTPCPNPVLSPHSRSQQSTLRGLGGKTGYWPQITGVHTERMTSVSSDSCTELPGWGCGKEPACQRRRQRDAGSIPGPGRSPAGGNGNPLRYSCLENPMGRGAWWATVHGVAKELDATACTPYAWTQVRGPKTSFLGFVSFSPVPKPLSDLHLSLSTSHKEVSQTLCIFQTTSITPLAHQHLMNSQNL